MSKSPSLVAAAALTLTLSAGVARADGNSAFSASNTALLMGNTASPGRPYVPTTGNEDRSVTGSVAAPAHTPAAHDHRVPARAPVR